MVRPAEYHTHRYALSLNVDIRDHVFLVRATPFVDGLLTTYYTRRVLLIAYLVNILVLLVRQCRIYQPSDIHFMPFLAFPCTLS